MKLWTRAWPFVSLLATNGCLMASPPELDDPERSRPYVHYLSVYPPLGEPIQVNLSDTQEDRIVEIILPFQSEDLGESVRASLHLYGEDAPPSHSEYTTTVPAGEFSTVRNIRMNWNPTIDNIGCYRLTATLAHLSSFGDNDFVPEANRTDAEAVSWLANVYNLTEGDNTLLSDCPRVGGVN